MKRFPANLGWSGLLTSLSFEQCFTFFKDGRVLLGRICQSKWQSQVCRLLSFPFLFLFFSFPLSWFSLLCGVALALSLTSVSPFVLSLSIYHTVKVERDVINLGE